MEARMRIVRPFSSEFGTSGTSGFFNTGKKNPENKTKKTTLESVFIRHIVSSTYY